jgi:ATP-binding cassette, subfamily B, bacterial PglK
VNFVQTVLIDQSTQLTLPKALGWLWRDAFSRRRRVQGGIVLCMMFVGAIAELFTIGAVIPFLAVFADPGGVHRTSRFASMFLALGMTPGHFSLRTMGLVFCGIAVAAAIIRIILAWVSQKYVFRIGFDIGTLLYRRMLHQPYGFHIKVNSSRIIATVENIQKLLTGTFIPIMQACTAFVIGSMIVIGLILLAPVLATVAFTGFLAIYSSISLVTRPRLRRNAKIIAAANRDRVQAVQEGLGGIRDVLIDNAQDIYLHKFSKIDNRLRSAQGANALIAVAPRFIAEAAGMILLIGLAIMASESGNIVRSLPVLGALALGAGRLLPLMQQSYLGWAKLMGDSALIINVVELLKEPIPPRFIDRTTEVPPLRNSLELHDVQFRYGSGQVPALANISICIPHGARVGLVGKSGSGKTTMLDLLMGLLQPSSGFISVDGAQLDETNILSWQKQVAHVPQHIFLLDSTMLENVAFGVPKKEIDYERVREACRLAELDEFIMGLPNGYETSVGERGVRLSGGQRQRIGIARALYKRTSILILDEATSALDDSTEANVIAAVQRLGRDYTVVMVAHRVTTLRECDTIYRLDQGHLVESGNFEQVLGRGLSLRGRQRSSTAVLDTPENAEPLAWSKEPKSRARES